MMVVLAPVVAFLMAESFTISGLLSIMTCAFLQSIYGHKNLEEDRGHLLISIFRALSYTLRSICDIMIGISFALSLNSFNSLGAILIIITVFFVQSLTFCG